MKTLLFITLLHLSLLQPCSPFVPGPWTRFRPTLTALVDALAPPERTDKMTKELVELLEVLDSKKNGRGPSLVVAQTAPSVRVAISEEYGLPPNAYTPGHLVAALKAAGFDLVLDTNTAADLTIMEEGTELLRRLQAQIDNRNCGLDNNPSPDPLPLFSSCCPGWLNFVEKGDPELAQYISSCKSPHMMYGSVIKEYSQELLGVPAREIYLASVMPCLKKRGESDHAAFSHGGVREVDNVITTRDLGQLLHLKGIDPGELDPLPYDSPFQQEDGTGTGAGQLFGATGGVMEAAIRTVYHILTGSALPRLELEAVRGLDGVRESKIPLYDKEGNGLPIDLRVAVCSGLGNAKKLIQKMRDGDAHFDFVEVMACPGGCINGGGQPRATEDRIQERLECIYNLDRSLPRRQSHDNPVVQKLYDRFLDEPGSKKAHRLLHVRPIYGETPKPKSNDK